MIDDDFRLLAKHGGGCACPLHMKRFNELAGTDISREKLMEIVQTEDGNHYSEIFLETQRESLVETARVMRMAIDSVNPKIPGSYCTVGNNAEFADEIAAVLAGEENPIVLRINNGNYTPAGARFFSGVFFRAAAPIAKLKDKVDVFLAETDTCPQNRYSTGAMSLHTHFTGTILEGVNGAKHWITRLISYEPQSGKAYRKVLKKHQGFYHALAELVPNLKWRGCRMHVMDEAVYKVGTSWNCGEDRYSGWGACVLERFGIPMYFSSQIGGILCLEGNVSLSDVEIYDALKGYVFLSSDSAECLIQRGFGQYLGVDVRPWTGKQPVEEKLFVNGNYVKCQMNIRELVPTEEQTKVDSVVCHSLDNEHYEELFAGSTIIKIVWAERYLFLPEHRRQIIVLQRRFLS